MATYIDMEKGIVISCVFSILNEQHICIDCKDNENLEVAIRAYLHKVLLNNAV